MRIHPSIVLFFLVNGIIAATLLYPRDNNPISTSSTSLSPSPPIATPAAKTTVPAKHWSYNGEEGPLHWASDYSQCREKTQSPVDLLSKVVTVEHSAQVLASIKYNWPKVGKVKAVNKGYSIEFTTEEEVWLSFKGVNYSMINFHYHTPSEHREANKFVEIEFHFVFKKGEKLLVVGVRFSVSKEKSHEFITSLIKSGLPSKNKEEMELKEVEMDKLTASLNHFANLYTYVGSLTVPPCTQSIQWLVTRQILEISVDDYKKLRDLFGFSSRPTTLGINEPDNIPI